MYVFIYFCWGGGGGGMCARTSRTRSPKPLTTGSMQGPLNGPGSSRGLKFVALSLIFKHFHTRWGKHSR